MHVEQWRTPCSCCHDDRSKDTKLKAFVYTFYPDNRVCLFSARYQESETLSGSSHHVVERGLAGLSYGFILATETNVRVQASELRHGFIGSVAACSTRKNNRVPRAENLARLNCQEPARFLAAFTQSPTPSRHLFCSSLPEILFPTVPDASTIEIARGRDR